MKFKLQIFCILLLKCSLCLSQSELAVEKKIDSLFAKYNSETPGVAVAVVENGKIIHEKGYGMANLEYDIPITPKTIFHVASVSKQFTTFAIYLLEKEDKISFDDNVKKYIPEIPDFGRTITIEHLCSHTSGLKDQWALLTLAGWRMDDVITTEQIFKLISEQEGLNFPPGTQFQYSNTGFTLLAEIVKRVSGMPFSKYVNEKIFQPLGMNNSQIYDDYEKIVKNRAYSYALENDIYKKRKLSYSNVGPTSLFTTVEDLAKWTRNFENPTVGDRELISRFNEASKLENGEPTILGVMDGETTYHAKGQFFRNYKGLMLYNHTGGDAGFRAYLARFPEKEFSVILLSNESDFDRLGNGLTIAELYLKNELKPRKDQIQKKANDTKKLETFNSSLSDFKGKYFNAELTTTYEIEEKNNKLIMSHRRLSDIELTRIGENKFSGTIWFNVELEFKRNKNNQVVGFNISNFGAKDVKFNRLSEPIDIQRKSKEIGLQLVQDQLTAYNSGNLEAFILPYSENIEIFNFPNNIYGSGKEFMKNNYGKLFSDSPNLHCEIVNRITLGNTIIDHERVSGLRDMESFEAIAIYKIENSKISKVYFIRKNE